MVGNYQLWRFYYDLFNHYIIRDEYSTIIKYDTINFHMVALIKLIQ